MRFNGDHSSAHGGSQQRVLADVCSDVDDAELGVLEQQVLEQPDDVRLPESVFAQVSRHVNVFRIRM